MIVSKKKDFLGDRRFTFLGLLIIFFCLAGKGIDLNQHTLHFEAIQELNFHPTPVYINIIKVEKTPLLNDEVVFKI